MIHHFICVSDIPDPSAKQFCKNLMDHHVEGIMEIHTQPLLENITFAPTMDDLIELAWNTDAEWGVFSSIGCLNNSSLYPMLIDSLRNADADTVLIGHILDRGEAYYELHYQSFVINLRKFRDTAPREIAYTAVAGDKPHIDRSDENFHDHYTPKSVSLGEGTIYVSDPSDGADLIAWALGQGEIRPFTEVERKHKPFLYPLYDIEENMHHVDQTIGGGSGRVYVLNTENILERQIGERGPWTNIIMPSSGFLPFEIARDGGINPENFRFTFFDISIAAMDSYRFIFNEWDGTDIHAIADRLTEDRMVPMRDDLDTRWDGLMDRFGGKSEWLSFFRNITEKYCHRYLYMNITREHTNHWLLDSIERDPENTLLSLSNIFTYAPYSMLRSHKHRMGKLQNQMEYWRTNYPEMTVHFTTARDSFTDAAKNFVQVPMIDTSHWHGEDPVPKGLTLDDIFPK